MSIRYAYQRGNTIYFQRAIPDDLQARYESKRVKIKLTTTDPRLAAAQVERLNATLEAEWASMRGNLTAPPKTTKAKAAELLTQWGIDLGERDPQALSLLYDHLDRKRELHAAGDERVYRMASAGDYLAPHEIAAAQMIAGTLKDTLSDALKLYLERHKKKNDQKFVGYATMAFGKITAMIGDKVVDAITREDAHSVVSRLQAEGASTGTIRRLVNAYAAILSSYFKEKEIDRRNPFASLPIPDEGKDRRKRNPFKRDELLNLAQLCKAKDDGPRWLAAMLMDTGARLAEIAGLPLEDIHVNAEVPYIVIQPHPWRSVKTAESQRQVPLTGMALWAARRICERAKKGQKFAFPQYNKEAETKADSASATLIKWFKAQGIKHIVHELRHTMADRLRDVQCPEDVRLAIGGWASEGIGNQYGTGYGLRVKAEWLGKVALTI
jgi:integrase